MSINLYYNRELSWLAFNHRILQEAMDGRVPLYERIKFMALFAENLDSFYRLRVAALTNLAVLNKRTRKKIKFNPGNLLEKINKHVIVQQEELFSVYQQLIGKILPSENICLLNEKDLSSKQSAYVKKFYREQVAAHIQPMMLMRRKITFFLQNKALYLAIKLLEKSGQDTKYALIRIPSPPLNRFVLLPEEGGKKGIIFIDDLLRNCLPDIFPGYTIDSSYSVKLNRDADQYSEDEFNIELLDNIKRGLMKRKNEQPSHFLYDKEMPKSYRKVIREAFAFQKDELIAGGRYHNFNDFLSFPNPKNKLLTYPKFNPVPPKVFQGRNSILKTVAQQDCLLYYPYHTYAYVLNFLNEAIKNPATRTIYITLYRVDNNSKIISTLINAVKQRIQVIAFAETKVAPEKNGEDGWAKRLENRCVHVIHSFPGLKVHAKLCLIEMDKMVYGYLSSGNFNENLAKQNCDFGFFTVDPKINSEVKEVFNYLTHQVKPKKLKQLLVSPFTMRKEFSRLVENEMKEARKGNTASIFIKVNNLQDKKIIKKLYEASCAGVKVRIIVRSICCLIPGIKGMSENIEVISLIDRFSEHGRVFCFHNRGRPLYYIGSADLMVRNLDRRVEVVFPVYNEELKNRLNTILDLQWRDNVKARIIEKSFRNPHRKREKGSPEYCAQTDIAEYVKMNL